MNYSTIINRLNLIKGLILLEELDSVQKQLTKLDAETEDKTIKEIIEDINVKHYSDAVQKIQNFVSNKSKLTVYENPQIQSLKIEIKKLETDITDISDAITELEKLIQDFGIRHSKELGDIVSKLLKLRKEKAEHEQDGSNEKKKEYEEAKSDYESYSKQYEDSKLNNQFELSEEEKQELKIKYRKASKLCHPDVVTDELKEQAEIVFRELNEAYEKNDLKKVTEILQMLEKGDMFIPKSEGINEQVKLKAEVINLRKKYNDLKAVLSKLKESETYQTIAKIKDWDEYFIETKQKLDKELKALEV